MMTIAVATKCSWQKENNCKSFLDKRSSYLIRGSSEPRQEAQKRKNSQGSRQTMAVAANIQQRQEKKGDKGERLNLPPSQIMRDIKIACQCAIVSVFPLFLEHILAMVIVCSQALEAV
jgi:hypothetical protein